MVMDDTDMFLHNKYKRAADKCYELLRGCSLPVFSLRQRISYSGKKDLTFVLKDDGRFIKKTDTHHVDVWKIKERC